MPYHPTHPPTHPPTTSFDIIISDLCDPLDGGPAFQLYTKEFYTSVVMSRLSPGGVFVTQSGPAGFLSCKEVGAGFLSCKVMAGCDGMCVVLASVLRLACWRAFCVLLSVFVCAFVHRRCNTCTQNVYKTGSQKAL